MSTLKDKARKTSVAPKKVSAPGERNRRRMEFEGSDRTSMRVYDWSKLSQMEKNPDLLPQEIPSEQTPKAETREIKKEACARP